MNQDLQPTTGPGSQVVWSHLALFEIEVVSPTAFLYRNNRQCVAVNVYLDARNANNDHVDLDASQLKTIRLIKYHGSEALPLGGVNNWSADYINSLPQFDYYPVVGAPTTTEAELAATSDNSGRDCDDVALSDFMKDWQARVASAGDELPPPLPGSGGARLTAEGYPAQTQTITFFVRTASDNLKLRVAAQIPRPAGGYIRTNTPGATPGSGDFDSSVELTPKPPYTLSVSQLDDRRDDAYNFEWDSRHYTDVDVYYWRLPFNLRIINQAFSNDGDRTVELSYAFRYPHRIGAAIKGKDQTSLRVHSIVANASVPDGQVISLHSAGGTHLRALRHRQVPGPGGPSYDKRLSWVITDNYGCTHKFILFGKGEDTHNYLHLIDG